MTLTPEMLAEKAALEKELGESEDTAPTASKLTPEMQAEKAQLEKELGGSSKPGTIMSYVKAGARGLDYGRAATTAPLLAMGLQKLTGKPVYNEAEDRAALHGDAPYPTSSELFKRAGMPDGYSLSDAVDSPLSMAPGGLGALSALLPYQPKGKGKWWQPEKGGFFDPNMRGALGTLTDAAIDPATYATLGGSQAAKAGVAASKTSAMDTIRALLKAPSNTIAKTGKKLYESGLKPLIQAGEEAGKANIGESLFQGVEKSLPEAEPVGGLLGKVQETINNIGKAKASKPVVDMSEVRTAGEPLAGTARQIRKQMLSDAKNLYNQRKVLFEKAGGENIDPFAAFEPYVNYVLKLVDDSRVTAEEGNKLISKGIDKWASRWMAPNGAPFGTVKVVKPTSPELATTWKTDMNNQMAERGRQIVEDSDMGEKLGKIGAGGLQHEAEATVGRVVPGGDKKLSNINSKLGELLTLRKSARAMSKAEANRAYVTAADAAIGGSGIIGGQLLPALGIGGEMAQHAPMYAIGALIGKKSHDIAKTTAFRTKAGSLLRQLGEDPVLSPAIDTLSRRLAVDEILSKKKGAK